MPAQVRTIIDRLSAAVRQFTLVQRTFLVVAVAAVAVGAVALVGWLGRPTMSPLFSGLSGTDASAIVTQLTKDGVSYELADGGGTILVPQAKLYSERIAMAAAGLPANADGAGYSLLDSLPVTLSVSAGAIEPITGVTTGGLFTATLTSPSEVRTAVVTATVGTLVTTTHVAFDPGPPAALQIVAAGSSVVGHAVDVLARVRDAYGNATGEGQRLVWSATRGSVDPDSATVHNGEARTTHRNLVTGAARLTAALPDGLRAESIVSWLPGPTVRLEAAPTSAPFPCCKSTSPMMVRAAMTCTTRTSISIVDHRAASAALLQMAANSAASSDAPPINPPSTSGIANSCAAFAALTLPP